MALCILCAATGVGLIIFLAVELSPARNLRLLQSQNNVVKIFASPRTKCEFMINAVCVFFRKLPNNRFNKGVDWLFGFLYFAYFEYFLWILSYYSSLSLFINRTMQFAIIFQTSNQLNTCSKSNLTRDLQKRHYISNCRYKTIIGRQR